MTKAHRLHPFDPKNKPTIHRRWTEERKTNCPVLAAAPYNRRYLAEYVEYTFINNKGREVYIPEFVLWIN